VIATVAPVSVRLSPSLTCSPLSSTTGPAPPMKLTMVPAVTTGPARVMSSTLLAAPLDATPSVTVKPIVRLPSVPAAVGSIALLP